MSINMDTSFVNMTIPLKFAFYLYFDSYKSDILQSNAFAIDSNCINIDEFFLIFDVVNSAFSYSSFE